MMKEFVWDRERRDAAVWCQRRVSQSTEPSWESAEAENFHISTRARFGDKFSRAARLDLWTISLTSQGVGSSADVRMG
jgi:hypothetical protein